MRSRRSEKLYLKDMWTSAARILEYTQGMDIERFRTGQITVDAVLRNFEILGEAAGRISEETR